MLMQPMKSGCGFRKKIWRLTLFLDLLFCEEMSHGYGSKPYDGMPPYEASKAGKH